MSVDLRARCQKNAWQMMEQNHTEGRGLFTRCGSCQPKPRAGLLQTAQSTKRGCQRTKRSRAVMGEAVAMHQAATARPAPFASAMRVRMACWLNFRLSMAEAW